MNGALTEIRCDFHRIDRHERAGELEVLGDSTADFPSEEFVNLLEALAHNEIGRRLWWRLVATGGDWWRLVATGGAVFLSPLRRPGLIDE